MSLYSALSAGVRGEWYAGEGCSEQFVARVALEEQLFIGR